MKRSYKVIFSTNDLYEVAEIITTFGERLNAYESAPSVVNETVVYRGTLSECYAYIQLKEGNYM